MSDGLGKLDWPELLAFLRSKIATEAGEEKLTLLSPAFSFEEALKRQERLQLLQSYSEEKGLSGLPSLARLRPLLDKARRGSLLSPEELFLVCRYLETGRLWHALPFFPDLTPLEPLYHELRISLDPSGKDLSERASPELAAVRRRVRALFEKVHALMSRLLRKYAREGVLREEHIFQRKGRLVLPVRSEHKNRVPGILHDVSQTGATVFIEPTEVVPVSNEWEAARIEEEHIRREILRRLTALVASFEEGLRSLEEALAEVDVGLAVLNLAREYRGRFPQLKLEGPLRLREAEHPFFRLKGETPVPNDFKLSLEKPILLISGPNFGGKTVALKTVGLCVLMAQAGFPIPASESSEIPVFEKVLADLGDDQTLLQQESSFSAHLRALERILAEARPGTLVLLDEPGRGTDPREGAALAAAVLETLEDSGALVVATTHYPELKRLALSREKCQPASMAFDEERGVPTYRLVYGALGASYGLGLARSYLPEEVVARAEAYLSGEDPLEALWRKLEERERELVKERELLKELRRKLQEERESLEREKEDLRKALEKEKEALREEMERRLQSLERKFQEALARWSREGRRRVEKDLKEEKVKAFEFLEEETVPGTLQVGQRVYLRHLRREGEVLQDLGKEVEVQVGAFRVAVPRKSIKVLPDAPKRSQVQISVSAETEVPEALHLLGLRVEEALPLVEKLIDRALLAGKREVKIVHGLGTGRLQRAIRAYLEQHEAVEAIRSGAPFEGGDGVTIVTLAPKKEAA